MHATLRATIRFPFSGCFRVKMGPKLKLQGLNWSHTKIRGYIVNIGTTGCQLVRVSNLGGKSTICLAPIAVRSLASVLTTSVELLPPFLLRNWKTA